MHFHWQNLNDRRDGTQGSAWKHGRAWWHFYGARHRSLGVEWSWSRTHPGVGVTAQFGGGAVRLHVKLLALALYFNVDGVAFRWPWRAGAYGVELYLYDGGAPIFRFQWGADPWGGRRSWRDVYVDILDKVLGYHRHSERLLSTHQVVIPMPERTYPATVELKRERWKRPRWPFGKEVTRCHVEIPNGIPHPGKGENAWDCDDDATFGLTCPAETVEEAVAKVVETVMRSRRRYGGSIAWQPKEASA